MKKVVLGAAMVLAMGLSSVAQANVVRLPWANVVDTLVNDGGTFGGCLARINVNISSIAPGCPGANASYVAFSCTGELQSEDAANRLFDTAQMALLTNRQIRFEVDTNKKHNGYCVATRAEIR